EARSYEGALFNFDSALIARAATGAKPGDKVRRPHRGCRQRQGRPKLADGHTKTAAIDCAHRIARDSSRPNCANGDSSRRRLRRAAERYKRTDKQRNEERRSEPHAEHINLRRQRTRAAEPLFITLPGKFRRLSLP